MKQPLKSRDKITQRMTRDGLTLDNQTTGESVNISSREAEQEYTAEPGGAAEKVLERADQFHSRHKVKKAAKDAGEVVAEGNEALHRPASRLQFTAEERADPELAPYIKKAAKRADKLDAAKDLSLIHILFGGTSNALDFLPLDRSGNRRVIPVRV